MTQPPPDALDDEVPEQPPLLACPMFRLHGNMPQARAHAILHLLVLQAIACRQLVLHALSQHLLRA